MLSKLMGKMFENKEEKLKYLSKFQKIEELFKDAEQNPVPLEKNDIPKSLENLYRTIKYHAEINGKKCVTIKEIEDFSPLYAHQIKEDILQGLVELGFNEQDLGGKHVIRFGKKISEHYYFLNLKSQKPLPINVKTVIDHDVNIIDTSELTKVDFVSIVRMRDQEVLITYELLMGHLHLSR